MNEQSGRVITAADNVWVIVDCENEAKIILKSLQRQAL